MKVAYDVSILGKGYINPKSKTGIFRVVESLLKELVNHSFIDVHTITLNNFSSIWDQISAELYYHNSNLENWHNFYRSTYSSRWKIESIYERTIKTQKNLIENHVTKNNLIYKITLALGIPFYYLSKIDNKLNFDPKTYDIYHSSYYSFSSQEALIDLPCILTIYDLIPIIFSKFFNKKSRNNFDSMIKEIDIDRNWVICISENTKNDFCNYTKMDPQRVFVTHLAASDYFYPVLNSEIITSTLQRYSIHHKPYILSLCTLEPRKNLSFLIRCFAQIIGSDPNLEINLVLVGVPGWKNIDIFKAVAENPQLKSRVIFTGYVPDQDLSAIYSGALAFVYPSLYEGFGLPPLEAMQCGTPVITSNTSSLPEVVGDAGIMIDPTQEDELCHALFKIVNDSNLRKTLSTRGLERSSQFSWAKCAEETANIYRLAIEHKK